MYVQTDHLGLNQVGAPFVTAAVKRPAVTPVRDGDRAQEDRRQQQDNADGRKDGKPVFRALLTESTIAGLNAASSPRPQKTFDVSAVAPPKFVRAEKRPETGPSSINSEETAGLFEYLSATKRNEEQVPNRPLENGQTRQAFADAAARYTAQSYVAANALAGRGETLELQA